MLTVSRFPFENTSIHFLFVFLNQIRSFAYLRGTRITINVEYGVLHVI